MCESGYFTPAPTSGFPEVYKNDPEALTRNLSEARKLTMKNADDSSSIIVEVLGLDGTKSSLLKTAAECLTNAIKEATGEGGFIVVPPESNWGEVLPVGGGPAAWLVLRLSKRAVETLTKGRVWSSVPITFFAYRKGAIPPKYLLTVGTFIQDVEGDIELSIREMFRGPSILPTIRALAKNNPGVSDAYANDITKRTLASLDVKVATTSSGNLVASIYCDSPTVYPDHWRTWVAHLRTLPYPTKYNPVAVACGPVRCSGCHADDHTILCCPFLLVPGWNGPKLHAASASKALGLEGAGAMSTVSPSMPHPNMAAGGAQRGMPRKARRGVSDRSSRGKR